MKYSKNTNDSLSDFSDDDSLYEDKTKTAYKIQEMKTPLNSIHFKNLPAVFFIISAVILSVMLMKFGPNFKSSFDLNQSYLQKYQIEYFSNAYKDLDNYQKLPIVVAQLTFAFVIIILSTLLKQRISVPELIDQKPKNFLMLFFGLMTITSMLIQTFLQKETLLFSRSFGLVENIFQIFNILSSYLFCLLSYDLLRKISFSELPVDNKYLTFKKLLLIFMFVQLICYLFNLLFISFYNPIIYTEKVLISSMIFMINVNSVFYFLMQIFFVMTLRHDLYYVNLHLEIRPDLEYFIECDEDFLSRRMLKV